MDSLGYRCRVAVTPAGSVCQSMKWIMSGAAGAGETDRAKTYSDTAQGLQAVSCPISSPVKHPIAYESNLTIRELLQTCLDVAHLPPIVRLRVPLACQLSSCSLNLDATTATQQPWSARHIWRQWI